MDTIYALASARGKAGVAVVRLSGPASHDAVMALCGSVPRPRRPSVRLIRDPDGNVVDQALVLVFPEGESYTGESVAEFHLHGSPAIVASVLRRLSALNGLRLAEPGEFTRRALENDRMDLAQVEGLSDLIEAETEAQRFQAMRVFSGDLGARVESWREKLIRAAALIEATIDFADEDVPVDVSSEVLSLLQGVLSELEQEVAGSAVAERIRDGFEVAIVGAPNVGKSTLLNRLAGREAALTSEVAGTTRDVIEVRMDLRGLPVTILDTAGLRATSDKVEGLGIALARSRAEAADLRVCLLACPGESPEVVVEPDDIVIVGKSDTAAGGDVSGRTGEGVDWLVDRIAGVLEKRASGAGLAVRERHRVALQESVSLIAEAIGLAERSDLPEIAAERLRRGLSKLDSIIGRVDVEDLLDEIFSRFCLGK